MAKLQNSSTASRADLPAFAVALLLSLAALPFFVSAQNNSGSDPGTFLARISEAKVDNEHGVTSSGCILVRSDGKFHLERRQQVLPSSKATLAIFESSLDSSQLERLENIVKSEDPEALPEYVVPPVSMDVPWFSTVIIELRTEGTLRKSGYWVWRERAARSPAIPADVKNRWQASEIMLRPVVEWFHGIEALKLPPSDAAPTQCSAVEP